MSNSFLKVFALACALSCVCANAFAQSAPEGNAHPQTQAISESVAEERNPFGEPVPETLDTDAKRAFADAVDLAPLRDLAVFHNGRVKIIDTLARETIETIMGRRDFVDFKVREDGQADKKHYDPLFTFIDIVIDPAYYLERPLIHVEYLPLREAFLDRLYPDKDENEWWKRLGRLKPGELMLAWREMGPRLPMDNPTQRALGKMSQAFSLYQDSWRNLLMVAPKGTELQWHHLSEEPASSPVANAAAALGRAWRAGDAAKANEAIRTLAAELPKINAENYPAGRRSLEATYNRVNAFEWGYWLYAISLLLLLLAFGTGRKWLAVSGVVMLISAVGMHGFGFVARCIIAERFAIQNQFESMTGLSLFAALVGMGIMILRKQWLFGAAAAGVGFMVLLTATQTGIPGVSVEREAAILNTSVLLKYHVTTVLVSYGLIALGFMVSLFYLGTHYAAKLKAGVVGGGPAMAMGEAGGMGAVSAEALGLEEGQPAGTARVLSDLDKAQMIILQLAFWTLGVGILLGAWWADHSWGRWWAFDPKELWALVTWIVYLIVIHLRLTGLKNRGLVTAWMSVVGFIVMLWTYFGVNLLLPGLHAYA
jgi:cytochrome c-type biogenesis protein CcsB